MAHNIEIHNEYIDVKIILVNISLLRQLEMRERWIILSLQPSCCLKESSFRLSLASSPSTYHPADTKVTQPLWVAWGSALETELSRREMLSPKWTQQHFPGRNRQSESVQETKSSEAGAMWEPQGLRPQALSTVLEVLRCQVFQNMTPESGRVVGPHHFKPSLCLDTAHLTQHPFCLSKTLWQGAWSHTWRPQGPLLA